MNWRGTRIDAELLVPPMPAGAASAVYSGD
jgi:hypothetical protein